MNTKLLSRNFLELGSRREFPISAIFGLSLSRLQSSLPRIDCAGRSRAPPGTGLWERAEYEIRLVGVKNCKVLQVGAGNRIDVKYGTA